MSGETPRKIGRGYARNLERRPVPAHDRQLRPPPAGRAQVSQDHPHLPRRSPWFAAAYLVPAGLADWAEVKARHVQEWIDHSAGPLLRLLRQQPVPRAAAVLQVARHRGPDEPRPNPMASMKPPKIGDKLVPVITDDELAALLAACKGGGFENRRDYAIISLFKDTGARLSELAGLATGDIVRTTGEAVVTGKGDKQRTVKYTYDTARALDRYHARARQAPDGPGRPRSGSGCAAAR